MDGFVFDLYRYNMNEAHTFFRFVHTKILAITLVFVIIMMMVMITATVMQVASIFYDGVVAECTDAKMHCNTVPWASMHSAV